MAVAPLAGAWIETVTAILPLTPSEVAPLAGAWIETTALYRLYHYALLQVAPLAGAWIET